MPLYFRKRVDCDLRAVARKTQKRSFLNAVEISATIVLIIFGIYYVNRFMGGVLNSFGIWPRTGWGLAGILFSPLLHYNEAHLTTNAVSLFILLIILFLHRNIGRPGVSFDLDFERGGNVADRARGHGRKTSDSYWRERSDLWFGDLFDRGGVVVAELDVVFLGGGDSVFIRRNFLRDAAAAGRHFVGRTFGRSGGGSVCRVAATSIEKLATGTH